MIGKIGSVDLPSTKEAKDLEPVTAWVPVPVLPQIPARMAVRAAVRCGVATLCRRPDRGSSRQGLGPQLQTVAGRGLERLLEERQASHSRALPPVRWVGRTVLRSATEGAVPPAMWVTRSATTPSEWDT